MANREFLMLAQNYVPDKHHINGWFWSEKLDGQRCFWDGGVTRGVPLKDIPWANTSNKNVVIPRATGLWTRYGNVICAPDWFVDGLPEGITLDGELYIGPQCLQETRSIVSRHIPDARWRAITFKVFESPSVLEFCRSGFINNPNFSMNLDEDECIKIFGVKKSDVGCPNFLAVINKLYQLDLPHFVSVVEQHRLPYTPDHTEVLYDALDTVIQNHGEGIILRRPYSFWTPDRNKNILKVKPYQDAEATVIGYKTGLGKHEGRLGSLLVKWNSITFDIGGFTDDERYTPDESLFRDAPGEVIRGVDVPAFPLGSQITFRYNGVTRDGIPREARYWRTLVS